MSLPCAFQAKQAALWPQAIENPCFPGISVVKNLPANAGDTGSSLGWEEPLEEEIATYSSIVAWEIPRTEKLQSMGSQRVGLD